MAERCGAPAEFGACCLTSGHTTPEHWCCPMHGDTEKGAE